MIFSIIFFSFFNILRADEPKPVQVPSVLIHQKGLEKETRSIQWHSSSVPTPSILNLPQMDEALNSFNGLQSRSRGSPGFSLRGSTQSGRVLILFNDIPLNFASGFGAPSIFLPKEMIGHISVIKGPASLFYGSQAMAGSLNFISKVYTRSQMALTLSDTDENFLPWRKGKPGHYNLHLATPLVQTKKQFLQASLVSEASDGQFPYQTSSTRGVRQFNGSQLSRLVINGKTQWSKLKLKYDGILGTQKQQSPGPVNLPLETEGWTRGGLVSLTPHYFLNDRQSLRSKVSYMEAHSIFNEKETESFNRQKTLILQNEWIMDFNRLTQIQFFLDHFHHLLSNSFSGNGLKQERFEAGPFVSFHLLPRLKYQMGGRYLNQGNRFLPTFKTSFGFLKNYESWISYSRGFRSPTLSDLFSKSPFFKGNPQLKPEESEQYEWGIKKTENPSLGSWDFDLRLFHMEYKNFIESFEIKPGIFSRRNQGQGYSRGVDFGVNYFRNFLKLQLNYNFLETRKNATGRVFRLSPRHQISWNGIYGFGSLNLEVQNIHRYRSFDVIQNKSVPLENWQQWNLLLHSQAWKNLKISLGLINVFNRRKELSLNYPEPQRRYWFQTTYYFPTID